MCACVCTYFLLSQHWYYCRIITLGSYNYSTVYLSWTSSSQNSSNCINVSKMYVKRGFCWHFRGQISKNDKKTKISKKKFFEKVFGKTKTSKLKDMVYILLRKKIVLVSLKYKKLLSSQKISRKFPSFQFLTEIQRKILDQILGRQWNFSETL